MTSDCSDRVLTDLNKDAELSLRETISQLQRKEAVLSYHQLQGLFFAIACSPEPIKPSEWFELIWLSDDPQFDDEVAARGFYKQLVAMADDIAEMTRQRRFFPFAPRY